jgi:choline dehydrogenase-like flavoprotein
MTTKNVVRNLNALDSSEPFEVCIIGSGPAGTILGTSLVQRGIRTLILESGNGLFTWLFDKRVRRLAEFESTGDTDYPVSKTRGRILGGTSNFWTGRSERFHPSDLEKNPYIPNDNPWPTTYDELDPYYEKAEKTLRVRGGPFSEYTPPRKSPLPLPPKPDISYLKSLLGGVGVTVDDSPTATPARGVRFFQVQREILPDFLASPHAALICGATVTRLIPNSDRRIVGAEVRTLGGEKKIARAKIYVVAGGGIETPRLLLFSRSESFPSGIGNAYDIVGRGFNDHPGINLYGKIHHTWSTIYPSNKIARSHQFYNTFRSDGLGSVLLVFRQAWIFPHHTMLWKISNIPKNMLSTITRIIRPTLYIGATIEMRVSDSNRVTLSEQMKDCFGDPLAKLTCNYTDEDLQTLNRSREIIKKIYKDLGATNVKEADLCWSRHHQSTCRMGDNPKTSFTHHNLHVHECPNLYLCGCEVFVTGGAMQPLLTIAALSYRLTDHLTKRVKRG